MANTSRFRAIIMTVVELFLLCIRHFRRSRNIDIQELHPFDWEAGGDYCCPKHCFNTAMITTVVDGLACRVCGSFCICYCKCVTYMGWLHQKKLHQRLIEEELKRRRKHSECPNCKCYPKHL